MLCTKMLHKKYKNKCSYTADYVEICTQVVPRDILAHLKKPIGMVKIDVLKNSWEVRLLPANTTYTRGRLSGGWKKCARDNSLKVDDVCVFELINKDNSVFKLTIFRNNV